MAIKKVLENGKTKYEVIVKVRDKSGKQVMRRKRWFQNEREARKAEVELLTGLQGFKTKVTWQSWSAHVNEKYRVEFRNSTYVNFKGTMEKWFDPKWNNFFVDEIKPSDVHKIIFEDAATMSSYRQRGLLRMAKRTFNIAVEEGLITRNPAAGIRVRCAEAKQAILDGREADKLLREAKACGHRFYDHWALALLTGMRSGELHSLRWTDVDFSGSRILISKAWTRLNGEGPTKTAKNRIYPMSGECRRFLEDLKLRSQEFEFVLPRLWEWEHGEQARILRSFCKDIGITEINFHDLRATFITRMLVNGVALSKVMTIVGHSCLKTTQGYLRLSGKDIEGATESLNIHLPSDAVGDNVVNLRKS